MKVFPGTCHVQHYIKYKEKWKISVWRIYAKHFGLKEKNKDVQNTINKTKDWAARSPQNTCLTCDVPEGLVIPVPLVTPVIIQSLIQQKVNDLCCSIFSFLCNVL
jgi:hypothetical protein